MLSFSNQIKICPVRLILCHHVWTDCIFRWRNIIFYHIAWHLGSYFSSRGSDLCCLHWKLRVLTPGPLGKSPQQRFFFLIVLYLLAGKNAQPKKLRITFYLADILRTSSQEDRKTRLSAHSEGLLRRGKEGSWIYRSFATKARLSWKEKVKILHNLLLLLPL